MRHEWVAAVPTTWNIVPNGRDGIMGTTFEPAQTVFPTVVYRRFTKGWRKPLRNAPVASVDHDLIPGPLIHARVGDRLRIHFKNMDTNLRNPHSMHFHGVSYKPSSDGAYIPGFSGKDGNVRPGQTYTYRLNAGPDSAGVWPYHDHSPSMHDSLEGGLWGALSIRGRHERRPDREFVTVFARDGRLPDHQRPGVRGQHAGATARRSATASSGTCSRSAASITPSTCTATAGARPRVCPRTRGRSAPPRASA